MEIELDGLLSLQYLYLKQRSLEFFSARNLPSLKEFNLITYFIHKRFSTQIFGNLSTIKELRIDAGFTDINLDDLVNLEKLTIFGDIGRNFNFDLFKNICNHLQELSIILGNIANEHINELFYGLNFPNLVKLHIVKSQVAMLEKNMFEGFPMLQSLTLNENKRLRKIDNDAFSSLTNLVELDLKNNSIVSINQKHFAPLGNLKYLNLMNNRLKKFDLSILDYIGNIEEILIDGNWIKD